MAALRSVLGPSSTHRNHSGALPLGRNLKLQNLQKHSAPLKVNPFKSEARDCCIGLCGRQHPALRPGPRARRLAACKPDARRHFPAAACCWPRLPPAWRAAAAGWPTRPAAQPGQSLRLLAEARWAHRMDYRGQHRRRTCPASTTTRPRGEFLLLSDDRSDLAPARFYSARWDVEGRRAPEATGVTWLRQADGAAVAGAARRQPPACRWPTPKRIRLAARHRHACSGPARATSPAASAPHSMNRGATATLVREIALPAMFAADRSGQRGPRDNLEPGGPGADAGRPRRLGGHGERAASRTARCPRCARPAAPAASPGSTWRAARPCARSPTCPTPIPLRPLLPGTHADNGVSEVLMLDAHRMLVLERAYAIGRRQFAAPLRDRHPRRQRHAGPRRADARQSPAGAQDSWWRTSRTLGLSRLDNTEGMCWGPRSARTAAACWWW